ncbi:cytochrome P450 [Auriscalpium vulgare]|uniref:Cytochrome P450 n=1 Tax=Auriscalpium vulgare TaxID=40419 RepID=A0ACB8RU91_9AGAM|nr:cytochrome P450 [Auriscalpium vulgare]
MTSDPVFASGFPLRDHHTLICGAATAAFPIIVVRYYNSPWRKLPPGPPGLPIIGNALEMRGPFWEKFADWRWTYGDVFYLSAMGDLVVVLDSLKAATDLFDRRAANYSDRPRLIAGPEVMSGGLVIGFQSTGPLWRRMRKASHGALSNKGVLEQMDHDKAYEAVRLALYLLEEPSHYHDHINCVTASLILSTTYGTPATSKDDETMKLSREWSERLERTLAIGAHLVATFPSLKHVPRRFAKWRREAEAWFLGLLEGVQADMDAGVDRPCLASVILRSDETRNSLSRLEKAWTAGFIYGAGIDTVATTFEWWMLAMIAHPAAQARAQAELDTVVGRARAPTMADLPDLPYVRATGMVIPAGTIVIPNIWAVNRELYGAGADADAFEPARHLNARGELDTRDEGHVTYGFGRRICVGRGVANASLAMHAAVTLWACMLGRAYDDRGRAVPVDVEGYALVGLVMRPVPFKCSIIPRFPDAPHILAEEREMRKR